MPIFQSGCSFEEWKAEQHEIDWKTLADEEDVARLQRRKILEDAGVPVDWPKAGLALSGGGIRSATFSLGLMRELAAQGLLHRFDYLSTVSGGSYIGAYYAGLFAKRKQADPLLGPDAFRPPPGQEASDPFSLRHGRARASLEWLRQSGRYLAPSGSGDYWYALGLLVRNWIGLHLVIGSAMMLVALGVAGFRLLMFSFHWPGVGPWPALLVHAPLLIFLIIPAGFHAIFAWGFWMTKRGHSHLLTFAQSGSLIIAVVGILLASSEAAREFAFPGVDHVREGAIGVAFFAIAGLAAMVLSYWKAPPGADEEARWDSRRKWLTNGLRWCAKWFVIVLVAAIVDAALFRVYLNLYQDVAWPEIVIPAAVAAVAVPVGRWLLPRLVLLGGSVDASGRPRKPGYVTQERLLGLGAAIAALILIVLVIGVWTVLAYRAVWPDGGMSLPGMSTALCPLTASPDAGAFLRPCTPLAGDALARIFTVWGSWMVILVFLSVCIAFSPAFLNLSGLTGFYAGRLRRAYLGAGNENRLGIGMAEKGRALTALDAWDTNDDILLKDYFQPGSAAPLHLINITLNETRGTGSHIVQRDRRGRNLVVSPGGIYCDGDSTGKLYRIPFSEPSHERLPLSVWIAISGAAFSTGLGSRTGFPISQLAGLANVRLGYWWRARNGVFNSATQKHLLREFTGDFSGPGETNWYLSDGGHFENTGAYELIRRRLPFIVVSDNGMDERFEYEDIANLVRKARIDFDCEVDFLGEQQLDDLFRGDATLRPSFGTLMQIAGGEAAARAAPDTPPADNRAVAALARLKYRDAPAGTLLLIKPKLTGDGPADLIRYKAVNSNFPQQSTLDQFFDEAQWESYYHLGRLIGQAVFGRAGRSDAIHKAGPDWAPRSLKTIF